MASPSEAKLKKEIHAILDKADLATMTAKKVRQQLEEQLEVDLGSRRKEIDKIVMDYVNTQKESDDEDGEENGEENDEENDEANDENNGEEDNAESSEDDEKKKSKKRGAPAKKTPAKKTPAKKAKKGSDESESEASDASDDYKPARKTKPKKAAKKKGSDSDSDTDWKKKSKKGGGRGYTREIKLSPALAELMDKSSMPRHEVVRKMWALIKERNLYDKSNRQFAICDDDLYKVMGVKRFRTFGMMKYLKKHFLG